MTDMPAHDQKRYRRFADKRRVEREDKRNQRAFRELIDAHRARRVW